VQLVREVAMEDLDALWDLIAQANTGMTSLKIDKEQLADRVERSQFAFRRAVDRIEGAPYVFVMEDTDANRIVGTSCIYSKTGGFEPFYAYRIESEMRHSRMLERSHEISALHLVKIHDGPTEIGSLFLLPQYRGKGGGKLLSLSRFLYMAAHPKRFAVQTIAEMRGQHDANGECPFWNALGSHFFQIDFPKADSLSMMNKQFIEDFMPRYPIYLDLLPKRAREAIGQVDEQTLPALAMLEAHGFHRNNLIDIFDGGPVVECETQKIKGVQSAKEYVLSSEINRRVNNDIPPGLESRNAIVARAKGSFVAVLCKVSVLVESVVMEPNAMSALQLEEGERVWVLLG